MEKTGFKTLWPPIRQRPERRPLSWRIMKRETKLIKAAILAAAALVFLGVKTFTPANKPALYADRAVRYVQRAIDGDTLKLSNGERVRLIGVDTPELHYSDKLRRDASRNHITEASIQKLGRMARDFTKDLVEGKSVRLEPMNPYERKVIHATLQQSEHVTTRSEGEEPYRRVIIERK